MITDKFFLKLFHLFLSAFSITTFRELTRFVCGGAKIGVN